MKAASGVEELIGGTPAVFLRRMVEEGWADVLVKLEYYNPGGSVKDRIALSMIEAAEREGVLNPGDTIIEPTSGNTGIGLAMLAASRGYRLLLVMPESMSPERRTLLNAFGAEYVLTPAHLGMQGTLAKTEEIIGQHPEYFVPRQFDNPANPAIHREVTAREIWEQAEGRLDVFVAGIGTGGTLTGAGEALKEMNPEIKVVGVEPASSPVISGGSPGPHKIQGIGAGFVPGVLNQTILDQIITVSDEDAARTTRRLAAEEGLLLGISSGAAVFAALQVAKELGEGKRVVTIAPDTGERYLSTGLFGSASRKKEEAI